MQQTAGYSFTVDCPYDGATLEPTAEGVSSGWESRAVVTCPTCGAEHVLVVTLIGGIRDGRRRSTPARRAALERTRARKIVA